MSSGFRESLPKITNDLSEIPGDILATFEGFRALLTDLKNAPPSIRSFKTSFVILEEVPENEQLSGKQEEVPENEKPSGKRYVFSADLYGIEFSRRGRKDLEAFNAALIPVEPSDTDESIYQRVQSKVEKEFNDLLEDGISLPNQIWKYRIKPDLLQKLPKTLKVVAESDISINLKNKKMTGLEKWAHWFAQRAAFLLAFIPAMTIALSMGSFWPAAIYFTASMLATWSAKEFGTFDVAEALLRSGYAFHHWLIKSKSPWKNEDFSLKKILKTGIFSAALGYMIYLGAAPLWEASMAHPFHPAINYAIGIFTVSFEVTAGLIGGILAQQFFWGFGINNQAIQFPDKYNLPNLSPAKDEFVGKENRYQEKLMKRQTKFDALSNDFSETANKRRTILTLKIEWAKRKLAECKGENFGSSENGAAVDTYTPPTPGKT